MPDHPLFARFYDRLTARTELAGLADMRHRLLSAASGRVLELGAGTGHNLEHYTDAVTELVLAEPDPNMAKLLRERLAREGTAAGHASVIEAPERTITVTARAEVSLAKMFTGQQQLCEELERCKEVSRFLLERAPSWLDGG